MSFKDLGLKHSYSSEKDNLLFDFYIPVLKEAISYKRITGFFSSTIFNIAADGMAFFFKNGGKAQFILNIILNPEDYENIHAGITNPERVIQDKIFEDISNIEEICKTNHARLLGWLLAQKLLEIKIGYVENRFMGNEILHQKVGILEDREGNFISFSGSNNESSFGWRYNSEKFKVFFDFDPYKINQYVQQDMDDFNELWNDKSKKTRVVLFPEAVSQKLIKLGPQNQNELNNLMNEIERDFNKGAHRGIKLRNYQLEAIKSWIDNNFVGIFEMATGTGKTLTALGAMKELQQQEPNLIVIIAVPYLHLIKQWEESIGLIKISLPIYPVHGGISKWKDFFLGKILDFDLGRSRGFIVITTHDTCSSEKFLSVIEESSGPILFIADEVHGLGSPINAKGFHPKYKCRLGLSATPERYFDNDGTNIIMNFFHKTVYQFTLKQAINEINPDTLETFLVPYEYHIYFIELTHEEMDLYTEISAQIGMLFNKKTKTRDEENWLEKKLRDRQDILKNADNKYSIFSNLIKELKVMDDIKHTLVYTSPQQIAPVQKIIREIGHLIQHKFTSGEDATKPNTKYGGITEREYILSNFDKGNYEILVAIKCLDEGVDVPSTKNAILLCSSGNPKEYIQRRGRVLRRFPGKEKAIIYDIAALPIINDYRMNHEQERTMILNQLKRLEEFASDAVNESEVKLEIFKIKEIFNL